MNSLSADYEEELIKKQIRLRKLLSPFFDDRLKVFKSTPEGYRMRAEFRIWHDVDDSYHVMFDKATKTKYKVDRLSAACDLINTAMQSTISIIKKSENLRKKLFQIDYLTSTTKELVISLIYHKPLDENWIGDAEVLKQQLAEIGKVNIVGRSKKQKIVLGNQYVLETLKIKDEHFIFKQIENSFTQPNALINVHMIEWTLDNLTHGNGDLLELYCGAGNFSIPLSKIFDNVLATEISKTSVAAAQYNIAKNAVPNLTIARLSSEEFAQAYKQTRDFYRLKDINLANYNFTTVLVDPPRAGLDLETIKLISEFNIIIYISCNPNTLADNLEELTKTHKVTHAALFDQFPFTEHIETGVILKKFLN